MMVMAGRRGRHTLEAFRPTRRRYANPELPDRACQHPQRLRRGEEGFGHGCTWEYPDQPQDPGAASATWRMPRAGASPLTVGAAIESLPSGGTSGQRTPSCTCRRTMLSRAACGRQSRTRGRQSESRRRGRLEHRRRQQEWQLLATCGRARHRRGDCDCHCAHDCDRSKAAQEGAGPRARDKIGCSARGGSGSGSHCAGAMKRRRSTPVGRPLSPRAAL